MLCKRKRQRMRWCKAVRKLGTDPWSTLSCNSFSSRLSYDDPVVRPQLSLQNMTNYLANHMSRHIGHNSFHHTMCQQRTNLSIHSDIPSLLLGKVFDELYWALLVLMAADWRQHLLVMVVLFLLLWKNLFHLFLCPYLQSLSFPCIYLSYPYLFRIFHKRLGLSAAVDIHHSAHNLCLLTWCENWVFFLFLFLWNLLVFLSWIFFQWFFVWSTLWHRVPRNHLRCTAIQNLPHGCLRRLPRIHLRSPSRLLRQQRSLFVSCAESLDQIYLFEWCKTTPWTTLELLDRYTVSCWLVSMTWTIQIFLFVVHSNRLEREISMTWDYHWVGRHFCVVPFLLQ